MLEERCHVAVRLRPRTQHEIIKEDPLVWNIKPPSTIRVDPHLVSSSELTSTPGERRGSAPESSSARLNCQFVFNECYTQEADNQQVYEQSVKHLTQSSQKGVTGLVVVYGHSSSGKQQTVRGSEPVQSHRSKSSLGLVSLAALDLLKDKEMKQQFVRLSAFALYNEQFYDLLCDDPSILKEPLQMQEDVRYERFKKTASHSLLLNHSKQSKEEAVQIPMLSTLCGARQELMKTEEEVFSLLRRVKDCQRFLEDKGIVDPISTHYIYQFNLTRINRSNSMSPGPPMSGAFRGSSPSFGRMDEHNTSVQGIEPYPYKGAPSAFRPYSQQSQAKPPSFSAAESNPFSSQTSKRVSITQSTLNILECAGCEGITQRNPHSSAREHRSLDALWGCITQGSSKIDSKLNLLLRPIERRGHISCSVIVCMAPTLSQIKSSFHSLKFGNKAQKLLFKPESNVLQSESSIANLLEQYERALALKSRTFSKSIYNSSSASSTSRTAKRANNLVRSSRQSPAPPSPKGESPRSSLLMNQVKLLQQRIIQQNKKLFIQNSHLQYYFNSTKNHPRSYKLLPPQFTKQVRVHDGVYFQRAGLIEPSKKLKRKLLLNQEPKKRIEVPVLLQALRRKDLGLQMTKQQLVFMHEEVKSKKQEIQELVEKLRKMKQMMDAKEFFIEKVKQSLNFHKERGDIMRCKLQFFQSLNPHLLSKINDEQIHALQNHYSYLQERLKEEKARRIYKTKIDSLKEKIKELKDAEDRRRLERRELDTPGAPPHSECNRTQDSILQDMLNSSLRQGENVNNLNQLPVDDSRMLNSSQVSYMTDPYLQLPIDEASFEDSGITPDDSVNASPFQKFAADNTHFQKIFSQLFLGGEESRETTEINESRQEEEESKTKERVAGRRQTAEKIMDDISYLDEGTSVYNEVEKILENPKSNRPAVEIIHERSSMAECEDFLKQNHFQPSEQLLHLQQKVENAALQGYESFEEELIDNMNLTIGGNVATSNAQILIQEQPESVEDHSEFQELITLPSDMIFSPRLLHSQKGSARNSHQSRNKDRPNLGAIHTEGTQQSSLYHGGGFNTEQSSWSEVALDKELQELEFETRHREKLLEEEGKLLLGGLKSRNSTTAGSKTIDNIRNFDKNEQYLSYKTQDDMMPATVSSHNSSSEHSSRGSKVNLMLRNEIQNNSFKRSDGKIPPRALKVVPSNKIGGFQKAAYDLISPKGTTITLHNTQRQVQMALSRSAASSAQSSRKELEQVRVLDKDNSFNSQLNDRSVEMPFQKIQKKLGGKGSSKMEKKLAKEIIQLKSRPTQAGRLPSPNLSKPSLIADLSLHSQSHIIERPKIENIPPTPQGNPTQSAKLLSAKGKYPEHGKKLKNLVVGDRLDKSLTQHPMTPTGTGKTSLKLGGSALTSGKKGSMKAYGMLAGLAAGPQPVKKR